MSQITYFLSLGSNQGDRKKNIQQAISLLKETGEVTAISSLYQTAPQDMPPGSKYFYNLVLCFKSVSLPQDLLKRTKEIEKQLGRDLNHSHMQSRPIDIDLLLANDSIIRSSTLTIPHPSMVKREFVLIPLHEIAPELIHPGSKKTIKELLNRLEPTGTIKKLAVK